MTVDATVEAVRSADGTQIAFERAGAGPPLILVDAALGFRGFGPMGPLVAELASSFTVITYDRRGRGESMDTPPYAVEREVEDLQALVDAAGGSAFAYGFSSGAVLLLHAALAGLALPRLALLEPPLALEDEPDESDLGAEVAELVAAGRRGDAVEHFNKSIGVPEEMLAGMREAPFWPTLEQAAHTLVYDTTITNSLPLDRVSAITTPVLVLTSKGSDERLPTWGRWLRDTLPDASLRTLEGEWHGVAPEVLAPVLTAFFTPGNEVLVVSHIFHAPVEKVWQAWTDEKVVQRWWRVDGFSNLLAKMDAREGGVSHVGMRASQEYGGMDYFNVFRYTRVVPRKLIQYISNFADKVGNVITPEAAGLPAETPMDKEQQIEFEDLGGGKTKVTVTEFGWLAGGVMIERSRRGLEQTLANIDRVLSE